MALEGIAGSGKGRVFYLIGIIAIIFYLVHATEPVPNYDPVTKQIIKTADSYIVPTNVTYFWALAVSALAFALAMSGVDGRKKITEREAARIAKEEIVYQRDILKNPRYQGEIEQGNVRPRRIIIKTGTEIFKWVVGMNITRIGELRYFQVELDPFGTPEAIIERKWEFGLVDACANCGKSGDIKTLLPEEIYQLRELRGVVRG